MAEVCLFESRLCCLALRLSGSTADLSTGVSESTRCALGRQKARRSRRPLLSTGVICVLMLRVSWVELVWVGFGLVWVGLLGCLVAGGYDVWLFEVDVGVGVELWRRLWCLLCFTVGRVLCAG